MNRVICKYHSMSYIFPIHKRISNQETRSRRLFYSNHTVMGETKDNSHVRSYTEIPTYHSYLPSSLSLLLSGGATYLHEHCDKRHKQLGPIYREFLGSNELIFLASTKLIKEVLANEGKFPQHNVPECWRYYNQVSNIDRGLFFEFGEPWLKLRRAFNTVMQRRNVNRFSSQLLKINLDLLNVWTEKNLNENNEIVINDVKKNLNNWSIECTGFMLFGSRMGCIATEAGKVDIDESSKARADEFVANISCMFSESSKLHLIPVKLAHCLNLSTWQRFEKASSNMLRIAGDYAAENISKAKNMQNTDHSLIQDLLDMGTLSDTEISRSVIDLLIAAADTTSNSLQWMLYVLAKYPNIQSKIYQELKGLSTNDFSDNLLKKAPYLEAFMREVSRLYPTAPFLARTLDRDIVIDDYLIPAGKTFVFSLYTTSRSEEYFERPLEFEPERWLSSNQKVDISGCPRNKAGYQHASLPFGYRKRMCVGQAAAELEMSLFIATLVCRFESCLVDEDLDRDMGVKLNMILCPERPIQLKLIPREFQLT